MKFYIDKKTESRAKADTEIGNLLHRKLNTSFYGKQMEDLAKSRRLAFVTD